MDGGKSTNIKILSKKENQNNSELKSQNKNTVVHKPSGNKRIINKHKNIF